MAYTDLGVKASTSTTLLSTRITGITWSPAGFATAMPFTSADKANANFSSALIGTNSFVAVKTGPHQIGCCIVSTNFTGVTGCALGYGLNAGGFTVEATSTSAPDGVRACATFTDIVYLTAGDLVKFYASFTVGTGVNGYAFMNEMSGVS